MLQQLIAPQMCKESTASNENYVELNGILHQKSKFLYTIFCYLVITRCYKQNKEFRMTPKRGTSSPGPRSDGTEIRHTSLPSTSMRPRVRFKPTIDINYFIVSATAIFFLFIIKGSNLQSFA